MVQFDVKRVQKGTESFMVSFDFTKTPITQIADYIIISASRYKSSDIHFDPREDGMMVRFRIDGDLQDYTFVPKAYEKNLTTRLKLLANMNITESRLPQDGAIKGEFAEEYLDMRVSSLPLNEGEKIVIRILDYTRSLQGIDSLGFHPKNLEKIKRMMELPNGIILTTGATGSGKSTTTYSILQGLNKPEINIITVEDPIEMNIQGINQVQVNAEIGMTFAAALRSILRQDPNVILIGEIRDSETAQIAVRASITGHLVLSTIHTNNALATVERLLDMDVERYLLSTALAGIISQRLAKMLCPDCKYQRDTTKYEKKVFKRFMNMDVAKVWDANPKGCDHCRRGYKGRIAIHEVLEIDENIRGALSNEKLDKKDLAKLVYSHGTISMLQDALIKCLEGQTSFEEVYRNIEIENEDDDNYQQEIETTIKDSVPKEEYVPESDDDLLESGPKKKSANDISSLLQPPVFTAADFADAPPSEDANKDKKANAPATTQAPAQPVNTPKPAAAPTQIKPEEVKAVQKPQQPVTQPAPAKPSTPTPVTVVNLAQPTPAVNKPVNPAQPTLVNKTPELTKQEPVKVADAKNKNKDKDKKKDKQNNPLTKFFNNNNNSNNNTDDNPITSPMDLITVVDSNSVTNEPPALPVIDSSKLDTNPLTPIIDIVDDSNNNNTNFTNINNTNPEPTPHRFIMPSEDITSNQFNIFDTREQQTTNTPEITQQKIITPVSNNTVTVDNKPAIPTINTEPPKQNKFIPTINTTNTTNNNNQTGPTNSFIPTINTNTPQNTPVQNKVVIPTIK